MLVEDIDNEGRWWILLVEDNARWGNDVGGQVRTTLVEDIQNETL